MRKYGRSRPKTSELLIAAATVYDVMKIIFYIFQVTSLVIQVPLWYGSDKPVYKVTFKKC